MIALSQALYDAMAAKLVATFNGGFIRLFGGTRPSSASEAETGTLLGIVSVGAAEGIGLHFLPASDGFYNLPTERMAFRGLADGTATWFRLVAPGDTGANSTTEPRIDGDIGTFDAPADMMWLSTVVGLGNSYTLDSFYYRIHPMGPTS